MSPARIKQTMGPGDIGEMRMAATAALGLFDRVEIDPAHLLSILDLAEEALRLRKERERVERILFGEGDRNRGVSFPVDMAELEKRLLDKLRTTR